MQQLFSYYYATFDLLNGPLCRMLPCASNKWASLCAHESAHLLDTFSNNPASVPFNRSFGEYMGLAHTLTEMSIIAMGPAQSSVWAV